VKGFRDELALLQKIRHPNVVQFLGAVTQSSPMMIVTEYLPKVFPLFISTITRKILSAELLEFSD
jgi:serine/threonine protein kinase